MALSKDGKQVAFRDQRNPQWNSPNDRAQGPWRVFDLVRRKWINPADFKGQGRARLTCERLDRQTGHGPRDSSGTSSRRTRKLPLPLHDTKREGVPFCWTFLPPTDTQPLRLAVGHLWGVSIYELTETSAKLVRLLTGHQGYVTALAASADGSYLVSASMDQTLSGWNLNDWPSQAALGASFEIKGDKLVVTKVDIGSPGWEAGLVKDDEVVNFYFDANPVDNGPQAWLKRLENPQPGTEHGFVIRRKGIDKPFSLKTTVRQRPIWRFFPTRNNEWVLWMWQGSYYDTSTKGDSYIGWVVNSADENREPAFYRAEQFRALYERADVLDNLLGSHDVEAALSEATEGNLLPPKFDANEPPFAALKLAAETTKTDDVQVTLTATPHGTNPDYQPVRTELWINDFRLEEDTQPGRWARDGTAYRKTVTIPNAKVRPGNNVLTFQIYNRVGGRTESVKTLLCTRPPAIPRLWGISVGVNDYGKIKTGPGGRGKLINLVVACKDAESIQKSWLAQTMLYKEGTDMFLRLDGDAKRADILAKMDELAKKVGPEDTCVIFLAGHGVFVEHKATKDEPPRTTWLFCCPNYDVTRPEETGITSEVLYAKLAAIPGRKLVILDACHSGEAAANPVRSLVPGGQGPIIIASCDRNQSAYEDPKVKKHGLFTYALLPGGRGTRVPDADKKKDVLDANDLHQYARQQMPQLLEGVKASKFAQVPILFAPKESELFPVVRVK